MDTELKEILERIENKIDALTLNVTRPEPSKDNPVEKTEAEPTPEN